MSASPRVSFSLRSPRKIKPESEVACTVCGAVPLMGRVGGGRGIGNAPSRGFISSREAERLVRGHSLEERMAYYQR